MLSVFPELFAFSLLGTFLIRVTVGFVLLYIGLMTIGLKRTTYSSEMQIKNYPFSNTIPWAFGLIEIITGVFLIVGFLTQVMVLIGIYLFINLIFIEKYVGRVFNYPNIFYVSMIFVSISILFLGPGFLAIDLPL